MDISRPEERHRGGGTFQKSRKKSCATNQVVKGHLGPVEIVYHKVT